MNQQNNNQNGHVKSKFFNEELFNSASINDIGSSTSGQVISYSVGKHKTPSTTPVEDINVLDSTQVINLVNSDVVDPSTGLFDASKFSSSMDGYSVFDNTQQNYSNNIDEVLNESRIDNNVDTNHVSNQFAQENPAFYGYNANPAIAQQSEVVNSVPIMEQSQMVQQPMMQPQPMIDQNMMMQQPVFDQNMMMQQPVMEQPIVQAQPQMMQAQPMMSQEMMQQPIFEQSQVQAQPMFDQNQMLQQPAMSQMPVMEQVITPQVNVGERDLNPINFDASAGEIDSSLIVNQPLSLMALSGEAIDEAQKPKDVTENSKFFQSTPLEDNRLKTEEVVPVSIAPVVDVLAEPVRSLNTNELVTAYIGPKYQQISMSPFSFCAFIFGPLYFFYRKMYFYGIIFIAINFLSSLLALKSIWIYLGCFAITYILAGLLANTLMLKNAKSQVLKIAALNPTATQYDLVKICRSKGGTGLALALVLVLCLNGFTSVLLNVTGVNESITKQVENMIGGNRVLNADTSALLEDVIDYKYPNTFVAYEEDPNYYVYYEKEEDKKTGEMIDKPACLVGIALVANYETSKELVEHMAEIDKRYSRVSSYEDSTKKVWDVYDYTANGAHTTYRARKINGHIVLITYSAITSATPGVCELYFEEIMNSIIEK